MLNRTCWWSAGTPASPSLSRARGDEQQGSRARGRLRSVARNLSTKTTVRSLGGSARPTSGSPRYGGRASSFALRPGFNIVVLSADLMYDQAK